MKSLFYSLTKFEWFLWISSLLAVILSFVLSGGENIFTLIASLLGATALIFVAKGYIVGQVLVALFTIFYGIVSFFFHYYGELITTLGMTAPIAIVSVISWIKNPYRNTKEVTIKEPSAKQWIIMSLLAVVITATFYFVLRALGNANLVFSTLSFATSFFASSLTFLRSKYYALGYIANDFVLIVLWVLATIEDISYLPMIMCFVVFLANDIYAYYNWKRIQKKQLSQ